MYRTLTATFLYPHLSAYATIRFGAIRGNSASTAKWGCSGFGGCDGTTFRTTLARQGFRCGPTGIDRSVGRDSQQRPTSHKSHRFGRSKSKTTTVLVTQPKSRGYSSFFGGHLLPGLSPLNRRVFRSKSLRGHPCTIPAWNLLPRIEHFFTEVSRLRIERARRPRSPEHFRGGFGFCLRQT